MKLIVGLGNPGEQYEQTRHNIGWLMLDRLADEQGLKWTKKAKFKSEVSDGEINGKKVLLAKPQTFMNTSGEAIRCLVDFYHLKHHDVLVLHDDADIDWGKLRVAQEGNDGGHQGVKSLSAHGLNGVWRFKIGVSNEHRRPGEAIDFVLTRFKAEEWQQLESVYLAVHPFLELFLSDQIEATTSQWL